MAPEMISAKCPKCGREFVSLWPKQLDSWLYSHMITHTRVDKPLRKAVPRWEKEKQYARAEGGAEGRGEA